MKITLICAFLLLASQGFSQDLENISTAFNTGDARNLAIYFGPATELTILSNEQSVDKTKGEAALREFFRQHPATGFNIIHKGVSKNGVQYAIGQFKSGPGNFRVSIYMKDKDGTLIVDNLQIEEE